MSENTMIERVARALCKTMYDGSACHEMTFDQWMEDAEAYLPLARAAIEAMREPTEAMIEACGQPRPELAKPKEKIEEIWAAVWETMIDAALQPDADPKGEVPGRPQNPLTQDGWRAET